MKKSPSGGDLWPSKKNHAGGIKMLKKGNVCCDICSAKINAWEVIGIGVDQETEKQIPFYADVCPQCYTEMDNAEILKRLYEKPMEYWKMWDDGSETMEQKAHPACENSYWPNVKKATVYIWYCKGEERKVIYSFPVYVADKIEAWEIAAEIEREESLEIPRYGVFSYGAMAASCVLDGEPVLYLNQYTCECGFSWESTWDCECDERCPECNKTISPNQSESLKNE